MSAFEDMKAAGVRPNTITYTALMGACEKGAQWELAMSVFEEMQTDSRCVWRSPCKTNVRIPVA